VLAYYLELAARSLRRSAGLTALIVMAIGFGVAGSMTMYSVFRGLAADPIPWKSSRLFMPQIDALGPGHRDDGEPPVNLTYIDAMELMRQHRAAYQSAVVQMWRAVMPSDGQRGDGVIDTRGYAVYGEFFPMLDVPFLYGRAWSVDDDTRKAPVAVISDHLNRQMFGGGDNVGKTLAMNGHVFRIVGILKYWNPRPAYFGGLRYTLEEPDFFLSLPFVLGSDIIKNQTAECASGADPGTNFAALLRSNCVWLSFMAELDGATAVQDYQRFLTAYASQQQRLGRFNWSPNVRLYDVPAFLDHQQVVPVNSRVSLLVAQGLLLVCLVNTVGLLLAKFLRRSGEIGVRRALGASRSAIYAQFLTEAAIIGIGGGVLGLMLTAIGVACVGAVIPEKYAVLARIDPALLALTLLLALVSTLLAASYPVYRASRVPPALQLKAQ
jgi:putative ABC transport system permease protein